MTRTTDRYLDEAAAGWIRAAERGELAEKRARGGPPAYSTGGWNSGPSFTDWNRTRRAPTPFDLVEAWRQLTFGCSVLNANAVSRQTLRLYVATGLGQHRPKSYLRGRPLPRMRQVYLRSHAEYGRWLKGADEIDEVTEHPLLSLIGEVNPDWDHSRLIRYTSLCLDIIGRAHWLPGDAQGNPMRGRVLAPYLWPLLAQYVLPYRETDGSLVSHYSYFSREYEPSDLVNFRVDSLRDPYALGQSPTQAAFAFVGLSDSYASLMENLLTQSVRPSVIVTNTDPDEPFGEAERKRLQREINYQLSAGGAGKAWVVDGAIDVKSLNVPPVSLAENEISETAIKYVSFIFGVPLSFLRNEDSNRAVAEAGHYQHATLGVEPRCVNIASTLTKWTHAEGRRRGQDWSRLLWAFDNPVKDDEEREAQVFDLRLRSGATTINEYRTHLGYAPVPWGDEPWMASSLVQPSEAGGSRAERASVEPAPDETEAARDDVTVPARKRRTITAWLRILKAKRRRNRKRPDGGDPGKSPSDKPPKDKPPKQDPTRKPRRGDKPTGSAAGDVMIVEPAGGRGNRYHLVHGGEFASPAGTTGHPQERVDAATTGTRPAAQAKPYFLLNKTHNNSKPSPKGRGPNGAPLQSHHLLQNAWAEANLNSYGYRSGLAPTVTLETRPGLAHRIISDRQNKRRDDRVAEGRNKWDSTIDEELGYLVGDFRAAGFQDAEIRQALDHTCRMLDKFRVVYSRPKGFEAEAQKCSKDSILISGS